MSSPASAVAPAKTTVQTTSALFGEITRREHLGLTDPKSTEELQQLWTRFKIEISLELANLSSMSKIHEHEKQADEKYKTDFVVFQKKCKEKLILLSDQKEKIVKVFSEYYLSGTKLIKLIPEKYQSHLDIIKETWDFILNVKNIVQLLAEESPGSADIHMFLYLQEFGSYNKKRIKLLGDIEKLSQAWKEKVNLPLQATSKIMTGFYKEFDELLTVSSRGFNRNCLIYIPSDMYEGISLDFCNYVNPKLVAVNAKRDQSIKELLETKKREYREIFDPLKNILTEQQLKNLVECQVASLTQFLNLATFEDAEELQGDQASFLRFEYLFQKKLKIEDLFKKFIANAKSLVDFLLSEKAKQQMAMLVESIQQNTKQECAQAEVQLQDRRKQKEIERARRDAASEKRGEQEKLLLLQKKTAEGEQQQQAIKMKIKQEILLRVSKMSPEEKDFMKDMFNNVNLHRKVQESLFMKLVDTLGFPCQETNKSSGGWLVTVHNQTLSFHHWEGDNPSTLDGNFIKKFKTILETNLGISLEDIAEASKVKAQATKK